MGRRIRVPEVRVINGDGEQIGIITTQEALRLAEEQGLELVEVNPRAAPPVCKIMDFGKFKYETSKKEKASRKHQSTIVLKEIKLRPKTDDHDLDFKVKHIRRFLSEGNKCKLVTVFRGREIVHPEMGSDAGPGIEGGERHRHGRAARDDGRAPDGHDHRPARRRDPRRGPGPHRGWTRTRSVLGRAARSAGRGWRRWGSARCSPRRSRSGGGDRSRGFGRSRGFARSGGCARSGGSGGFARSGRQVTGHGAHPGRQAGVRTGETPRQVLAPGGGRGPGGSFRVEMLA